MRREAAEEFVRVVGRGFIPGVTDAINAGLSR